MSTLRWNLRRPLTQRAFRQASRLMATQSTLPNPPIVEDNPEAGMPADTDGNATSAPPS